MRKFSFAVLGCGNIGKKHAYHSKHFGILKAVCDINKSKVMRLASRYSCNAYYDPDEMLHKEPEVDIVSVCTPNYLHAEHSIKYLRAGHNVLCEKPMALSVEECRKMIRTAEKCGRNLFVVKQNRFNPPVEKLKELIAGKKLGNIYSVQLTCFWNRDNNYYIKSDWKGKKDKDGGILFTQFSHFIDLVYWLFGDIRILWSQGANLHHKRIIDFDDTIVTGFKILTGGLGTMNFSINSYSKNMEGAITVIGSKGTIKIGGQYLNVLEYFDVRNCRVPVLPFSRPANSYGHYTGSMSNHDRVYSNIINFLYKRERLFIPSADGLKTIGIIEQIHRKMKQKRFS